jgi:indolepyruvate ferredoxin oxidoreductase
MHDIIEECVGAEKTHFINAVEAVEQLVGGTMAANIYLAGFAYQKGMIPISSEAICRAIELNGAAVEENLNAFKLGRLSAHDPAAIQLKHHDWQPLTALEDIISDRRRFLTEYQDIAYADRYEALVRKVQDAELLRGEDDSLTRAVAHNYFRVLAYKDEYEVARLYTDGKFQARLQQQFEGNYKLRFHLAPPVIAPKDKHTGLPKKLTFGGWMLPVFKQLARFRFLRGTRLDPFAYSPDRKLERQLIADYEQTVASLVPHLGEADLETAETLLRLPERIRGFGYIKKRNADLAQTEKEKLLARLDAKPEVIRLFDPKAA